MAKLLLLLKRPVHGKNRCFVTNAEVLVVRAREQAPRTVKALLCGSFINKRSACEDGGVLTKERGRFEAAES